MQVKIPDISRAGPPILSENFPGLRLKGAVSPTKAPTITPMTNPERSGPHIGRKSKDGPESKIQLRIVVVGIQKQHPTIIPTKILRNLLVFMAVPPFFGYCFTPERGKRTNL